MTANMFARSWADMAEDDSDSDHGSSEKQEVEGNEDSLDSLPSDVFNVTTAPMRSGFDPDLDSSRDGLPLMFKTLSSESSSTSSSETFESLFSMNPLLEQQLNSWEKPLFKKPDTKAKPLFSKFEKKKRRYSATEPNALFPLAPSSEIEWSLSVKKQKIESSEEKTEVKGKEKHSDVDQGDDVGQEGVDDVEQGDDDVEQGDDDVEQGDVEKSGVEKGDDVQKGVPPRELSPEQRLKQRQKQIDLGRQTVGYSNYAQKIQRELRMPWHPQTPDKNKVCSKRSWDGMVRKWRRLLHRYDPLEIRGQAPPPRPRRRVRYQFPVSSSLETTSAKLETQTTSIETQTTSIETQTTSIQTQTTLIESTS